MKVWVIPATCLAISLVLVVASRGVLTALQDQEQRRTDAFLAIKTDDLNVDSFEKHYRENFEVYDEEDLHDLKDEIQRVFKVHPDGGLFHFDTPEEAWKNLGGHKGYAILADGKIVWKISLARS